VNDITIGALAAGLMIAISIAMGIAMIVSSHLFGRHKANPAKLSPYESGMPLLDASRKRLSIKYFIVGLMFILFDVEMVFLYPFAVIRGQAEGFMVASVAVFFLMIIVTYLYLLKEGAFQWDR
jgi:NADH:ubiquinone oxidoreductase subunit 3 (subunit A)